MYEEGTAAHNGNAERNTHPSRLAPFCLMSVLELRSLTFAPPLRAGPLKTAAEMRQQTFAWGVIALVVLQMVMPAIALPNLLSKVAEQGIVLSYS